MPLTNGILRLEYTELPSNPYRLGRHMELDARSLGFMAVQAPVIKPAEHPAVISTLDQGQAGSCTGNAGTYHLSERWKAKHGDLSTLRLAGKTLGLDSAVNEQFAVELYHEATVRDGFPGTYPPTDTGSSGLGVCKALRQDKLIGSYVWATSARGLASLLQTAGCIIGMPWYEGWFSPDTNGFIDSGPWAASPIAGGHEVYIEALEAWDEQNMALGIIRVHNSWASSWGDHGCFRMRLSTYVQLRSQIDVKQFVL